MYLLYLRRQGKTQGHQKTKIKDIYPKQNFYLYFYQFNDEIVLRMCKHLNVAPLWDLSSETDQKSTLQKIIQLDTEIRTLVFPSVGQSILC